MADRVSFTIDGERVEAYRSQSIMDAAMEAGVYIPRLCHVPGLDPWGSCRVCTVKVNGRFCAACTQPAMDGLTVENETEELNDLRRELVEMLFVGGNHFCMFCEKSGNCELQAMGYRLGITAPTHPYLHPHRDVDASHPDILLDRNRCILCARCVRTSRDLDGKQVFDFVNRAGDRSIAVDPTARLRDSEADVTDRALDACPVGALLRKREGFRVPVGQREYDHVRIGEEDRVSPVPEPWTED
jgi:[NiFe] hydrogenase diaphorase moiety small subunit